MQIRLKEVGKGVLKARNFDLNPYQEFENNRMERLEDGWSGEGECTMVLNRKRLRQNSYRINHFPTNEEVSEVSKRANE